MSGQQVSETRLIPASPQQIFDLLSDPSRHSEIDGSGWVQNSRGDCERLTLGSKFGMDMKFAKVVPYRITNTVVEYEKDRLIAWEHLGKHRWRYELAPAEGGTAVTETFDYSTAVSPRLIELMGYPKQHRGNIHRTLERMERRFSA